MWYMSCLVTALSDLHTSVGKHDLVSVSRSYDGSTQKNRHRALANARNVFGNQLIGPFKQKLSSEPTTPISTSQPVSVPLSFVIPVTDKPGETVNGASQRVAGATVRYGALFVAVIVLL